MFYPVLDSALEVNAAGGGDTGAPQVHDNAIPTDVVPHRLGGRSHDRVARLARRRRRLVLLDELSRPASPVGSAQRRRSAASTGATFRCPPATSPTRRERESVLDAKPRHWRAWYDGRLVSNYEAPRRLGSCDADGRSGARGQRPQRGRVRADRRGRSDACWPRSAARGWDDDVDVIFTTDHGELQGDFGLLFKGPYHVDGLMRLPLVWRPAPSAGGRAGNGHTAGRPGRSGPDVLRDRRRAGAAVDGGRGASGSTTPTPIGAGSSGCSPSGTASCSGSRCTCARSPATDGCAAPTSPVTAHDGTEGELYDLVDDPLQQVNRWGDPTLAAQRADLLADLWDHQPAMHSPLRRVEAPV